MKNLSNKIAKWLLALRNRHFFGLDLLLLSITPMLALLLRTDSLTVQPLGWDDPSSYVYGLIVYTLLALLVRMVIFYAFGLYRRYWRYASIDELDQIAWAVFTSTLLLFAFVLIARLPPIADTGFPLSKFPRSVVLIDGLLALFLVGGVRFSVRLATYYQSAGEPVNIQRVLIMGAGDAGAMIVREMRKNPALGLEPVGFVDDDLAKRGVRIHGVQVLGDRTMIPELVADHHVRQVIIAMPTAPGKEIREIVRICEQTGAHTRIIPGLYTLLDGTVSLRQVRDVQIEDLLRREPIQTDITAIAELLCGTRVLVTGGGGSIGSELCRQILRCHPAELIILGHGENSVFEVHNELLRERARHNLHAVTIRPLIGDVRFADRVLTLFREVKPEIVFHAAAHKHVPLMEGNPAEAITNNVLGTRNVLRAALDADVARFVMISTDKAVNPTSVMGASKRTAELLVHEAAIQSGKPYVAVRFGNVLGSRGSVVLTFKQQIADGGPVTVTDPEMKRFFMTIPEAVQLVLQAGVLGNGGEVFLLDMGEPVKIVDLAHDIIRLSGLEVDRDIDVVFTGLRPGEKLFEELFTPGEQYTRTRHEKIFIAANASAFVPDRLNESIAALERAADQNDRDAIVRSLQHLIPEFDPPQPPRPLSGQETSVGPRRSLTLQPIAK